MEQVPNFRKVFVVACSPGQASKYVAQSGKEGTMAFMAPTYSGSDFFLCE